jgi:hypothetical protein
MSVVKHRPRRDAQASPPWALRPPSRAPRSGYGWAALTLATLLLPLLLLALPAFARQVYTLDDLGNYHLPLRSFYAQCLARGDAFDWCPRLYGGFYLHGEGQGGLYHPFLQQTKGQHHEAHSGTCCPAYPARGIGKPRQGFIPGKLAVDHARRHRCQASQASWEVGVRSCRLPRCACGGVGVSRNETTGRGGEACPTSSPRGEARGSSPCPRDVTGGGTGCQRVCSGPAERCSGSRRGFAGTASGTAGAGSAIRVPAL